MNERDSRPVVADPEAGEPVDSVRDDAVDTPTPPTEGAAAAAMAGKSGAGYAAGVILASEDEIGPHDAADEHAEGAPPDTA